MEGVDLQQQHPAQLLVQRAVAAGRSRRQHCSRSGPGCPIRSAPNPSNWNTFNYGTQRNTWGGNGEFSGKTPWFIRADYNEVKTNGIKPGSGQLGTGSGNGLIELGARSNTRRRTRPSRAATTPGSTASRSRSSTRSSPTPTTSCSGRTSTCAAASTTRCCRRTTNSRSGAFNGYIKQLPWDSAIIARFTQSKLTNSFGIASSSLKPTGNAPTGQVIPPGVATCSRNRRRVDDSRNASNFNGNIKTTTANVAWNASPMAQLDTRVYYDYYDLQNDSTSVSYRRAARAATARPRPSTARRASRSRALAEEPASRSSTRRTRRDSTRRGRSTATTSCSAASTGSNIDRQPSCRRRRSDDYRYWVEYRNTGWPAANLTGRLKYEYLQRRSDLDSSITNNRQRIRQVPTTSQPTTSTTSTANVVKFNIDWTPGPMWFVGVGATWRDIDYKDNLLRTHQGPEPAVRRERCRGATTSSGITGIGNWGKVKYEQDYRNTAGSPYPPPSAEQLRATSTGARRTRRTAGWPRRWSTGRRPTSGC